MTEKKNWSLGENVELEFSSFKLLDKGFGLGTPKLGEKREEKLRRRDLGLLAKMRKEIRGRSPRAPEKEMGSKAEKDFLELPSKTLLPLDSKLLRKSLPVADIEIPRQEERELPPKKKTLPPPLLQKRGKSKKKRLPLEGVLSQQMKRIPTPKEEVLGREKLEKARKQIQKKYASSWSFLLLGHFFDLLVVVSLLASEILLLGALFKREDIFLLDVLLSKFNLSNLSFFSVVEGVSFLYLAYFLYYLLFSLFLGRSLGFFFLSKIRKNTQGKKA